MKLRRALLVCTAMLLQAVIACDTLAAPRGSGRSGGTGGWSGRHGSHGGHKHHHHGFFFGAGFYAPWFSWWYSPYWYPYAPYYPLAVPVQLEQYATPLQNGFWYYCHSAGTYYPGVAECAEGWEQVPPRPDGAEPR